MTVSRECGVIYRALSGFYYVKAEAPDLVECRARGKFRKDGISPLVGDRVTYTVTGPGLGVIEELLPRKNVFFRPPLANIDLMVILAAAVNPVTDPFLIDRVTAIAERNHCDCVICINKCDLDQGDKLFAIYQKTGYRTIRTSSVTGEGIGELRKTLEGKICSFVGNSGVGKSSLLNALKPVLSIPTAQVSEKLGRGRHTTRHVELYPLPGGALVAGTPGFSSFDPDQMGLGLRTDVQYAFIDFAPHLGECLFRDCAHVREKGCAVLAAVEGGDVAPSRHRSYVRLYDAAKQKKEWERKDSGTENEI